MATKDLIEVPVLTKDDEALLKEIFAHPTVLKYLTILGRNVVKDIAYAGIGVDESPEVYIRQQAQAKGALLVIDQLFQLTPLQQEVPQT